MISTSSGTDTVAVFVHYGEREPTLAAVDALSAQSCRPGHVIVVVNDQNVFPELTDSAEVSVLRPGTNLGYAGAVNHAVRWLSDQNTAKYVWILNTDLHLTSRALEHLRAGLHSNPDADVIGGILTKGGRVWFAGGTYNHWTGRARHIAHGESLPAAAREQGSSRACDWINGACMLVPLRVFQSRGPWREDYFLYREELEWQIREPKVRARVVCSVLGEHLPGGVTGGTHGRLGYTFMARNTWLGVWSRPFRSSPTRLAMFLWDYLLVPALRGRWNRVSWGVWGVRKAHYPGREIVGLL